MYDQLKKDLLELYQEKPHRLQHVLGVRDTAIELGKLYQCDVTKLEIAALLHDSTKYYSYEENIRLIQQYYPDSETIIAEYNEHILHAFSAVVIARTKYNITDNDILDAIMSHTIGKPGMSIYEEIIFISDYIEPNRTYESCVKVRALVKESLTLAIFTAIDDSIQYYETHNGQIPQTAYEAREYYKQKMEEQQ